MTGTDCGLFTHKLVPVIFEPPCSYMARANLSLCFTTHNANKAYESLEAYLDMLYPWPLQFRRKNPGDLFNRKTARPQSRFGHFSEEKNLLLILEIEIKFLGLLVL